MFVHGIAAAATALVAFVHEAVPVPVSVVVVVVVVVVVAVVVVVVHVVAHEMT